jgi:hypothetical protein
MADPEWILEEAIRDYPGHCAEYYAGMCRFNIPYVRKVIKEWISTGRLRTTVDRNRSILDEAVEFTSGKSTKWTLKG